MPAGRGQVPVDGDSAGALFTQQDGVACAGIGRAAGKDLGNRDARARADIDGVDGVGHADVTDGDRAASAGGVDEHVGVAAGILDFVKRDRAACAGEGHVDVAGGQADDARSAGFQVHGAGALDPDTVDRIDRDVVVGCRGHGQGAVAGDVAGDVDAVDVIGHGDDGRVLEGADVVVDVDERGVAHEHRTIEVDGLIEGDAAAIGGVNGQIGEGCGCGAADLVEGHVVAGPDDEGCGSGAAGVEVAEVGGAAGDDGDIACCAVEVDGCAHTGCECDAGVGIDGDTGLQIDIAGRLSRDRDETVRGHVRVDIDGIDSGGHGDGGRVLVRADGCADGDAGRVTDGHGAVDIDGFGEGDRAAVSRIHGKSVQGRRARAADGIEGDRAAGEHGERGGRAARVLQVPEVDGGTGIERDGSGTGGEVDEARVGRSQRDAAGDRGDGCGGADIDVTGGAGDGDGAGGGHVAADIDGVDISGHGDGGRCDAGADVRVEVDAGRVADGHGAAEVDGLVEGDRAPVSRVDGQRSERGAGGAANLVEGDVVAGVDRERGIAGTAVIEVAEVDGGGSGQRDGTCSTVEVNRPNARSGRECDGAAGGLDGDACGQVDVASALRGHGDGAG